MSTKENDVLYEELAELDGYQAEDEDLNEALLAEKLSWKMHGMSRKALAELVEPKNHDEF